MKQDERTLAGRYLIGRRIGRGGMAEVYAATDERLGRRVAVKLLNTTLAGEQSFRQRFRQEAQAAARMTHPTIVRVFDAGEDTFVRDDGREITIPYIVMEYVDGRQLRDVMADGPLSQAKIQKYMDGILISLEYSHRAGIVHRDIKPGNVMITPDDQVKVMDFGIARAISDTAGTIAQTTAILGTASYFSPEQARGEQVDGRSDLYSAGIVLYEMLTGRVPFQGDSAVAVAYQHVTEHPPSPRSINPEISSALEAVTMRALAKRREDRYQSAGEFRHDLDQAFLGVMPVAPAPATNAESDGVFAAPTGVDAATVVLDSAADGRDSRAPRVQRRPPAMWIWGAAALVALVAVAVLIWAITFSNENELPPVSATVPDVAGQTWEQASAALEAQQLTAVRADAPSESVPRDQVISTTPPAGSTVNFGTEVTVTVSVGPANIDVPDVSGRTEDAARQALEAAGLTVGDTQQEDSVNVAEGLVTRTSPSARTTTRYDNPITLFVSTGKVTLPDLRGTSLEDARQQLLALELVPVETRDSGCYAASGNPIVNMSVPAGKVDQHSQVRITYCTGTRPRPTQTSQPTSQPSDEGGDGNGGDDDNEGDGNGGDGEGEGDGDGSGD